MGRLPIAIKNIGWWFWKDSREGLRKLRRGNMAFWRGAWPNFLGRLHDFLRKSMTRFFRGGNMAFWRGTWPDFLGRLNDFLRKSLTKFSRRGNVDFWKGAWLDFFRETTRLFEEKHDWNFLGGQHSFLKRFTRLFERTHDRSSKHHGWRKIREYHGCILKWKYYIIYACPNHSSIFGGIL